MMNYYYEQFHENVKQRRLQESIIYSLEIDFDEEIVIAFSDYGHISLHEVSQLRDRESESNRDSLYPCPSKTLVHDNLPVYSSYFYQHSNKKILFTGGSDVIGWDWKTFCDCPHGGCPEGRIYQCGSTTTSSTKETFSMTGNQSIGHLYTAGSEGTVHSYDIETGSAVNQYHGHTSSIHTLSCDISSPSLLYSCDDTGVICLWDIRASSTPPSLPLTSDRKALNKGPVSVTSLAPFLRSSLTLSPSTSLWASTFSLDIDGNFLYVGGGTSTATSSGWLASIYVGGGKVGGDSLSSHLSPIGFSASSSPIQELTLHDNEIVCGGPLPQLRYFNTSLEHLSTTPTSSSSVFALKSYPSSSSEKDTLLVVAGASSLIDVFVMKGHKAASLSVVI